MLNSHAQHIWSLFDETVVQIQKTLYTTQENLPEEYQDSRYPTTHYVSSVKNNFFACTKCSNFPGTTASWSPVQKLCHKSPGLHILFSDEETFLLFWYVSKQNCGFVGQRILINFGDVWETAKTLNLSCGLTHRRALAHYFLPRSLPVPQQIRTYWSSLFLLKWWSYINRQLPAGWYST